MHSDIKQSILAKIPHRKPFRFIDTIEEISDCHIIGTCYLNEGLSCYEGHFPGTSLTPGFIVTEAMAQVGILGLGIYLSLDKVDCIQHAFLTTADVKFHKASFAGDTITVDSRLIYFRLGKLQCSIKAYNQRQELICSGTFSGMIR